MNEELRIQTVKQFAQLNLRSDRELKNTISLAAKICATTMASITLVGRDKQLLKVNKGLSIEETPRNISFCTHTIKRKRLLLVNDTHTDLLFKKNPLVVSGPKIRFYAGYPLTTHEGQSIGALCVMDNKPHVLSKEQKLMLTALAKHAMSLMEFKLSLEQYKKVLSDLKELRKQKSKNDFKLRAMFESLSDAYFLLGRHAEVIDFNHKAYNIINEIYGIKLSSGRIMTGFLSSEYRDTFNEYYLKALGGTKMRLERQTADKENGQVWWECYFEPVKDEYNEIVGVSYIARDITERKLNENKIIEQNAALLKIAEIQSHDYRGPLASILGLMNLIAGDDYIASKEYLLMLHKAVSNLDEKIHGVVNLIDDSSLL